MRGPPSGDLSSERPAHHRDEFCPGRIARSSNANYHIYPKIDRLDGVLDPFFIETPQSAQNDADVQSIVDALNRIASRMDLEG
jgi:hypothetical protein